MITQTATASLAETNQINWLQRLGLFILFLLCEAAIFIFGSHYFNVFPTNKSLTFNLTVSAIFLVVALWFKYDQRWNEHWQIGKSHLRSSSRRLPIRSPRSSTVGFGPYWGLGRNWRKSYGVINIKDRILADFFIILLDLPEKSRFLLGYGQTGPE